jgi:hypothetical protein
VKLLGKLTKRQRRKFYDIIEMDLREIGYEDVNWSEMAQDHA